MSRSISFLLLFLLGGNAWAAFPGIGRPATPEEIRAWDIDVRADFKGLPKGSGSVKQGMQVWEAKCASCHGVFGESNQVYPPIAGGVTPEDLRRGRVAALARAGEQRTTLMKLSRISTLWDYINRAMPWNAPKTLTVDEVYALTAYILSLDRIVPDDFVLSERSMAEVQKRLPNRNGMTREHGLWSVRGRPDVRAQACMRDCPVQAKVVSQLPDHARGSHGNLAEQMRTIGPGRGRAAVASVSREEDPRTLAEKTGCLACHGIDRRLVGPSVKEIAERYRAQGVEEKLVAKVREGGHGAWGAVPMPPHPQLSENELRTLVKWVLSSQSTR